MGEDADRDDSGIQITDRTVWGGIELSRMGTDSSWEEPVPETL